MEKVSPIENREWLNNNRIRLAVLFGISGLLFFLLLLDSHYKNIREQTVSSLVSSAFGSGKGSGAIMKTLESIKSKLS